MTQLHKLGRSLRRLWTRSFWTNLGLQTKLGLMVAAGLIALVGIFGLLSVAATRETVDRTLRERVILAQLTASHLDYVLGNHREILLATADYLTAIQAGENPPDLQQALHQAIGQVNAPFLQWFLTDARGDLLVTEPPAPATISLTGVIPQLLPAGAFVVTRVDRPGHVPSVIAAVAVRDPAGQMTGALAVSLDLTDAEIWDFLQMVTLGQTGYLELVDQAGLVLLSTRPQLQWTQVYHSENLMTVMRTGKAAVATCYGCHEPAQISPTIPGSNRWPEVVAFAPLKQANWGVVIRQSEEEAFASSRRLQGQIILLGVLAVMGAMVLVWLTTRSIITPVRELTTAAERIADGDLQTPIRVHGRDEVGVLARTLDDMRARLWASITETQALNRDLDRRVQERTQECVNAQVALRESRDYLQSIIDGLDDLLLVVGPDQRVRQANRAARQYRGDGQVVGLICHQVSHPFTPCQPPNCQCPLPTVFATGQTVRVTHYHPDGRHTGRYLEVVASPLRDANGQVQAVIELLRDVTEERELRERLVQRNRDLSALNLVATAVTQPFHLNEFLNKALEEVLRVTGVDVGSIFLLQEETGSLELQTYRGISEEVAQAMIRLHLGDSACSGVMEKGQPVVIPDLRYYRAGPRQSLRRAGLQSLVHVPLFSHGIALGTLCVATQRSRDFQQEEIDLLMAIGNQIAIGVENARLYVELARREQLRGELLEKLITVQEEERKRIALDLHDDTSQALAALIYSLEATEGACTTPEVRSSLAAMRQLATQTLEGIHKLIFDLRPSMLDHLGLFVASRWYAETRLQPVGVRLRVEERGALRRLPPKTETALFRVVQETINNIARHAGARNVRLTFDCQDSMVQIEIEDDGIGFDLAEVARSTDQQRGLGLVGMQERVGLLGGRITITSTPGQGTRVSIQVPVEADNG